MEDNTRRVIVWFRQDLRLHDNEALTMALSRGDEVYPVYVFDPRVFQGKSKHGFPKTGIFRAQFILESVIDLQKNLRELGCELIIRMGNPEEEIALLAKELRASWIFANREPTWEEAKVQNALEKNLWQLGQELHFFRGKMLYYTQDLPFPISQTPDIFSSFRKEVERFVPIRKPLESPKNLPTWSYRIATGTMPSLLDLGYEQDAAPTDERAALQFRGGESEALARLKHYLWDTDAVADYKETRNGLLGADYSTKFSAWLAQGCLSPKKICDELAKYEEQRTKNKSTYWLFFELLWRDFFRLMGKKYGSKLFHINGLGQREPRSERVNMELFAKWAEGRTGQAFIDANMIELRQTGFLSNRGRQNVASYLVNDLKLNWQLGAEYFEQMLIDYDVCSNWGNWNYIAGVGNDPREDRYFNPLTQARRYDPEGDYVRHWLPKLKGYSGDEIHSAKDYILD